MTPPDAAYVWQDFYIRDDMLPDIRRYVEHGILPGDFLQAVISNDLKEACGRADEENMKNLPAYVAYLYNEAPAMCWGSKERMEAWMKRHQGDPVLVEVRDE